MSEWKRKVEAIIAFIVSKLPWRGPATPKLIVNRILQAARRNAEDWGHDQKKQAPNHYSVQVNLVDWEEHYAKRKQELQDRISKIAFVALNDRGYKVDGYTTVELSPGAALGEGRVKIYPSFLETQPFPKPVHGPDAEARPKTTPATVAQAKTATLAGEATSRIGVRTRKIPTEAVAVLRGAGKDYEVRDGYRVGSGHGACCTAQIELEGPDTATVSRDHGVFTCNKGAWSFWNKGSNGTLVRHVDGKVDRLEPDDSCSVANGDRLSFAHGKEFLFVA